MQALGPYPMPIYQGSLSFSGIKAVFEVWRERTFFLIFVIFEAVRVVSIHNKISEGLKGIGKVGKVTNVGEHRK